MSHVYYPATNNGYIFTYSAYGMITTVSLRKDMSYDPNTNTSSDGTEKAYVTFNYPASFGPAGILRGLNGDRRIGRVQSFFSKTSISRVASGSVFKHPDPSKQACSNSLRTRC